MITKEQIQHAVRQYIRGFTGDLLEDEYIKYVAHYGLYSVPECVDVAHYMDNDETEMANMVRDYYSLDKELSDEEALEYINNDFKKSNFTLRLLWEFDGGSFEHLVPEDNETTVIDMVDFIMDDYSEYQDRIKNDDFWRY